MILSSWIMSHLRKTYRRIFLTGASLHGKLCKVSYHARKLLYLYVFCFCSINISSGFYETFTTNYIISLRLGICVFSSSLFSIHWTHSHALFGSFFAYPFPIYDQPTVQLRVGWIDDLIKLFSVLMI